MRTLDIHALSAAIREKATQLKEAKKQRRIPPGGYTWAILCMKAEATMLCAIRASHREKVHLPGMSLADQAKMITKEREQFALKTQPVAAVG